jgi:RNA polymerase sigma factor (sigma-70 family)
MMANKPLNGVLQHVRKLAAIQAARDAADQQLLQRFVRSSDEAALTVLIERHAPMVLGVCRRALGCMHDAEDACQATFLVFSRKAATIRKTTALGSWLHAVALRVTANLKRERARRERRERNLHSRSISNPADEVSWAEVQTALDEELERLPERYRAVLILCYLQGKTRDEAADQLGISAGALHGLLERGRKLLAARLTRRGFALSAGLFGMALSEGIAPASLTSTQVLATSQASSLFALGKPVGETVSATVLQLSQHVLKGMFMTKLKIVSGSVVCAALLITTVGFTFAQTPTYDYKKQPQEQLLRTYRYAFVGKTDTDEAFIKRVSKDLRGVDPTPAEIHFFVNNKDPKRRDTLVDLFIKEREAKKAASTKEAEKRAANYDHQDLLTELAQYYLVQQQREEQRKKEQKADKDNEKSVVQGLARNTKSAVSEAQLDLLKANVDVASAIVRQCEVRLQRAQAAKAKEIDLLTAELQVARANLERAQAELKVADKKATK